jgi:hypothetical protein
VGGRYPPEYFAPLKTPGRHDVIPVVGEWWV